MPVRTCDKHTMITHTECCAFSSAVGASVTAKLWVVDSLGDFGTLLYAVDDYVHGAQTVD